MIRCEKLAKIYPGPVAALVDVDLTKIGRAHV